MTIMKRPLPDLRDDADFYARALATVNKPVGWTAAAMRVLNAVYYLAMLVALGWLASMAMDRTPPVRVVSREVVSPVVRPGGELLVRTKRIRDRQCELVRRYVVYDATGKRHEYWPEPADAFGHLGPDDDVTAIPVPFDAAPGRARSVAIFAWDCNPLQRALGWSITWVAPTLEFEIARRHGEP